MDFENLLERSRLLILYVSPCFHQTLWKNWPKLRYRKLCELFTLAKWRNKMRFFQWPKLNLSPFLPLLKKILIFVQTSNHAFANGNLLTKQNSKIIVFLTITKRLLGIWTRSWKVFDHSCVWWRSFDAFFAWKIIWPSFIYNYSGRPVVVGLAKSFKLEMFDPSLTLCKLFYIRF